MGVEMLGRRRLHSCESAQEMDRKLREHPELSPGVTHHLMLRGERSGSQAGCWLGPWGRGSSSPGSRDPSGRHWLMLRQAAQHQDTGSSGNGVLRTGEPKDLQGSGGRYLEILETRVRKGLSSL